MVAATEAARVSQALGEHGHWVRELRPETHSLEDLFLEMTSERRVVEPGGGRGMNLLMVEMRRALRRRVVRVLILLALVGCVVAGVIAFVGSSGKSVAELRFGRDLHPAVLTDWWVPSQSDGAVLISAIVPAAGRDVRRRGGRGSRMASGHDDHGTHLGTAPRSLQPHADGGLRRFLRW